MSITDINQAKMIKALKEHGHKVNKKETEFLDIPDELKAIGVDEIMSTNGKDLTEEDIQDIMKVIEDLKEKGTIK